MLANPVPVTHPESEDSFVFRTRRGYHLLTNVNNDHARCGPGVACGVRQLTSFWGRFLRIVSANPHHTAPYAGVSSVSMPIGR